MRIEISQFRPTVDQLSPNRGECSQKRPCRFPYQNVSPRLRILRVEVSVLIGRGVNRLEQRITDALYGGKLHLKESKFIQDISRKIGFYRERTNLSELQAGFLFTILTRAENGNACRPSKRRFPILRPETWLVSIHYQRMLPIFPARESSRWPRPRQLG